MSLKGKVEIWLKFCSLFLLYRDNDGGGGVLDLTPSLFVNQVIIIRKSKKAKRNRNANIYSFTIRDFNLILYHFAVFISHFSNFTLIYPLLPFTHIHNLLNFVTISSRSLARSSQDVVIAKFLNLMMISLCIFHSLDIFQKR